MYSLLVLGFISFAFALVLTPICRNVFLRLGIVDHPDAHRKLHTHPIPRIGGIPIILSYLAAFGIALLLPLKGGSIIRQGLPFASKLLPAVILVFAIGLLDDLLGLKPWQKFAGQFAAAGLSYWAGVHISFFGSRAAGWWCLPLTLVWLVGCANAFNLIDGVDGLAAGVGLFATATTLVAALAQNNAALAFATVPLVGCLFGFLRYNFNPATIFLGDSGSLLIGFLLGCYGVLWSQKSATLLGMTAPLMALAIPLLDTALAIARRFLRRQPIFQGDRGHIHHRLLERGLTPRRVALLLYGVCGIGAAFSLLLEVAHAQLGGLIVIVFCAVAWIGIQHLGYLEFGTAGRMLMEGAFRRLLDSQLTLASFQETLAAAATPRKCWEAIDRAAREYGFVYVFLRLAGQDFTEGADARPPEDGWTMRIPISDSDVVILGFDFQTKVQPTIVAPFAAAIRNTLAPKLEALRNSSPISVFEVDKPEVSRSAEAGAN
jgi:UDP-GlcNAc:undecaprenyl-phosphate GlcNAc-1-phosphate transferase